MVPIGRPPLSSSPTMEPMVFDPESYAGAQIRLVAVDMDGTLLDDEKNFPPGLDELIDQLEKHGIVLMIFKKTAKKTEKR